MGRLGRVKRALDRYQHCLQDVCAECLAPHSMVHTEQHDGAHLHVRDTGGGWDSVHGEPDVFGEKPGLER